MKNRIFVLGIALLWLACGPGDVDIDTSITVPVSVEEIKLGPIEEFVTTTGTVRALKEVELVAENEGYYRLGRNSSGKTFAMRDKVSPNDAIVHLDNPEVENTIKIESQKLNLDISKSEFEKQQALYDKGGVTYRELKNAEQAFIDAQYNYENAIIQLKKLTIQSPFSGIIVDLPYFTEGVLVSPGEVIAKVMNYEKLYMDVNFPGKHMGTVNIMDKVRILNYTLPEDTLWGNITQVSPAIDPDTRTFKAAIKVGNPDWTFRPGMFVQVETIVASKDSAIVIPKELIIQSGGAKRVFVVERGAANDRRIITGLENPTHVEVLQGLQEGDRLIVKGYETLSDNTRVKVIR